MRELTRMAVPQTEAEWSELARGKSIRELEQRLVGKARRLTRHAPRSSARRRVLRFEVSAETFALFREAMADLRRRSEIARDDAAALLGMARRDWTERLPELQRGDPDRRMARSWA